MIRQSMRGGLVGHIEDKPNIIFSVKNYEDFPEKSHELITLLGFQKGGDITQSFHFIYGSSRLRIQPYYGDFDTINMVEIDGSLPDIGKTIEKSLQNIIKKVLHKGYFITDIKCGRYKSGNAIHWTQQEILNSYRDGKNPDTNGNIGENVKLYDAIMQDPADDPKAQPSMIKFDMIAPFGNRYLEITAIYLIVSKSGKWFFFADNYLQSSRMLKALADDVEKYKTKNRPFKIIKRLFSLCRMGYKMYSSNTGIDFAKMIVPIIGSNISRMSSVYSDLSVISLLLETNKKIDKTFTINSIQAFKEKWNVILDLENVRKNDKKLDLMANTISGSIMKGKNNDIIIEEIEELKTLINDIITAEINIYFKSKNTTMQKYTDEVIIWVKNLMKTNIKTHYFVLSKQNKSVILTSAINDF